MTGQGGLIGRQLGALGALWPLGALGVATALSALVAPFGSNPSLAILVLGAGAAAVPLLGIDLTRRYLVPVCLTVGLMFAGLGGGLWMHLVPILVVASAVLMLADGSGAGVPSRARLLAAGAGAGLLSLLLAGVILRPRPPSGRSGGGGTFQDRLPRETQPEPEPGTLDRLVDAVRRLFGLDDDGAEGRGEGVDGAAPVEPRPETEADPGIDWLLILVVVGVLLLLAMLAWLLYRWLSRRGPTTVAGERSGLVARLEAIGAGVGAPRGDDEGLIAYGDRLSPREDRRPREAGSSISEVLYDPAPDARARANAGAEATLSSLEGRPPATPQAETIVPPRSDLVRRLLGRRR